MLDFKEKIVHGNPGYPIAFYKLDKNHVRYNMNFHWHPEFELIRILSGRLSLRLGNDEFEALPGQIFFLPGGTLHSGEPHDCDYECIVFDICAILNERDVCRTELAPLIDGSSVPINPLPLSEDQLATCNALFDCMGSSSENALSVKGLLFCLLGMIMKSRERMLYNAPRGAKNLEKERVLQRVTAYIEENIAEHITLEMLADIAGMTPNYFCRFFKKATGSTPIAYLVSCRISRASSLLSATDVSVTDAALSCGFGDISYFINTFKKEKKMTPLKFKEQHKKARNEN